MSATQVVSLENEKRKNKKENPKENSEASPESIYSALASASEDVASTGGLLYRWTGIHWAAGDVEEEERIAFGWLRKNYGARATPQLAKSCVAAAVLSARRLPKPTPERCVLPLRNGYLHFDSRPEASGEVALCEADKAAGLTYEIATEFKADAQSPRFDQFIAEVLPDPETRGWIQEYVGYSLLSDCRFQKALFLLGSGANGKSAFASIISHLHAQVVSMAVDRLEGFQLMPLTSASLVVVDETPTRIAEQALKKIISGGMILVDRKYRDPITIEPRAKWLVLGNQMPSISDQTHGFWRRFVVVEFPRQFSEVEQDPHLAHKIVRDEMPGVLLWALHGLARLTQRGHFPPPSQAMKDSARKGLLESNSVAAWWADGRAEINSSAATPRADVYKDYHEWARENGMSAVGAERFWPRLALVCGMKVEPKWQKIDGKPTRVVPVQLLAKKEEAPW